MFNVFHMLVCITLLILFILNGFPMHGTTFTEKMNEYPALTYITGVIFLLLILTNMYSIYSIYSVQSMSMRQFCKLN